MLGASLHFGSARLVNSKKAPRTRGCRATSDLEALERRMLLSASGSAVLAPGLDSGAMAPALIAKPAVALLLFTLAGALLAAKSPPTASLADSRRPGGVTRF